MAYYLLGYVRLDPSGGLGGHWSPPEEGTVCDAGLMWAQRWTDRARYRAEDDYHVVRVRQVEFADGRGNAVETLSAALCDLEGDWCLARYYKTHPRRACTTCLALFRAGDEAAGDRQGQVHTAVESTPAPKPKAKRPVRDMTATMRRLRARKAAYAMHAKHGNDEVVRKGLEAARKAAFERFVQQVDPNLELPEEERRKRAKAAQMAHLTDMAYRSVKARQRKRKRE